MQYEAETPREYLEQLEDDWRKVCLLQLRDMIFLAAPDIEECIHYKMLGYVLSGGFVFHLNAQRNYVSLYAGNAKVIDPDGAFLEGLSTGKGCVRFTKSKPAAGTRIAEFIQRAVFLKREGAEFGC